MTSPQVFETLGVNLANPIRLMYMSGVLWRLAQDRPGRRLQILEIGSWLGTSALTWGYALAQHNGANGRVSCIDSWQSFVDHTINRDDVHLRMEGTFADDTAYRVFCRNMTLLPAGVELAVLRGSSTDIVPTLPQGGYDLVYIDGDHSYGVVREDIANSMRLVADGGILCGDDLELQAHEVNAEIAREQPTLDYVSAAHLSRTYHPGVTLAVGELLGRVSAWEGFWAMRKRGETWEPVVLDGMPYDIPPHLPMRELMQLKLYLMQNGLM